MSTLVTLREAKQRLNLPLDITAGDSMIQAVLDEAEAVCLTYVNQNREDPIAWALVVVGWTPATVPLQVRAAILMQFAELYRFRGDDERGIGPDVEYGYLHPRVTALLYPFRDPAIA